MCLGEKEMNLKNNQDTRNDNQTMTNNQISITKQKG
jgi:hypothetical protein